MSVSKPFSMTHKAQGDLVPAPSFLALVTLKQDSGLFAIAASQLALTPLESAQMSPSQNTLLGHPLQNKASPVTFSVECLFFFMRVTDAI